MSISYKPSMNYSSLVAFDDIEFYVVVRNKGKYILSL